MSIRTEFPALGAALLLGASTPLAKLLVGDVPAPLLAGLLYLGSGLGLSVLLALRWARERGSGQTATHLPLSVTTPVYWKGWLRASRTPIFSTSSAVPRLGPERRLLATMARTAAWPSLSLVLVVTLQALPTAGSVLRLMPRKSGRDDCRARRKPTWAVEVRLWPEPSVTAMSGLLAPRLPLGRALGCSRE